MRIQSKHLLSLIRPKKERRVLQNWRQRIRTNRTSKGRSRKADLYLLLFLLLLTLIDWSSRGYSQTLSSCVCASLCTSPTSFVFPNTWETGKRYLTSHTLMTLTLYCVLVQMMCLAFRSKKWTLIFYIFNVVFTTRDQEITYSLRRFPWHNYNATDPKLLRWKELCYVTAPAPKNKKKNKKKTLQLGFLCLLICVLVSCDKYICHNS